MKGWRDQEDRLSVRKRIRPIHAVIVLVCIAVVITAAAVQHLVPLGFTAAELKIRYFIVPILVGSVFGVLLVRGLIFRETERQYIRDLRQREADINQLNANLTKRVEERTGELVEKERQLLQAQKMEAVGRLAAGVAHDFNNLLGGIMGLAEMLSMDLPEGSEMKQSASQISTAAVKAGELTRQLLALGRQQVMRPTVVNLIEVIATMAPIMGRAAGEKIALKIESTDEPLYVWADRGQVEQILLNLVINARDAIDDRGEICIASRLASDNELPADETCQSAERWILTEVSDTGHGMDAETLGRIFEPFFSTKPAHRGTGLGLSIVAGIVEQSGGCIRADSTPGQGSSLRFYLPITERTAQSATPERDETPPTGRSERVILVENDPLLRDVLGRALDRHGYAVETLTNGEEALARFAEDQPAFDILVCDLVLPGHSGLDVVRALVQRRPASRAMVITGYGDGPAREELLQLPDLPVLQKPFTAEALLATIHGLLEG